MAELRMTSAEMVEIIKIIEETENAFTHIQNNMDSLIEELSESWRGDCETATIQRLETSYNVMIPTVKAMLDELSNTKKTLMELEEARSLAELALLNNSAL